MRGAVTLLFLLQLKKVRATRRNIFDIRLTQVNSFLSEHMKHSCKLIPNLKGAVRSLKEEAISVMHNLWSRTELFFLGTFEMLVKHISWTSFGLTDDWPFVVRKNVCTGPPTTNESHYYTTVRPSRHKLRDDVRRTRWAVRSSHL